MKFTALLLLTALAGTLVVAQDASPDSTEPVSGQDPATSELAEGTEAPLASASPQKTTQTTQKTSQVFPRNPGRQAQRFLKSFIGKGLSLTRNNIEGVKEGLRERIQDGKHFIEDEVDDKGSLQDLRDFFRSFESEALKRIRSLDLKF